MQFCWSILCIYFHEYSKRDIKAVKVIRLGKHLAGIPTIVYGLFGMIIFVNILGL